MQCHATAEERAVDESVSVAVEGDCRRTLQRLQGLQLGAHLVGVGAGVRAKARARARVSVQGEG